ncbi:TIGR04141 family sporadically distributed protein [Kibdelosporangium lantanae]
MAPRSVSQATSLYRLEGGRALTEYLAATEFESDADVRIAGVTGRLVTGSLRSDRPKWAEHVTSLTGEPTDLPGVHPFAVLLIPLDSWTYALTWGSGHLLLEDELVEQGFGLLFGIRRLDEDRLGLIASAALDATARTTQTSYPGGSDLSGFRLEPYGELVTRMAGSADLAGLTYGKSYRIRVGDSLWAPFARHPENLLRDLRAVSEVVDQTDEHSALRFVAQVKRLQANDPMLPELNERLAEALGGDERHGPLGLAWPSELVHEAEQATEFRIRTPLDTVVVDGTIELVDLTDHFAGIPVAQRVEALRRGRVTATADGTERSSTAGKWIAFETTVGHTRFCYLQNKWFKIGENYVGQIRDQVATLLTRRANLTFPTWVPTRQPDDEHQFCRQIAGQPGYLCLDKDFATTPLHPRFELCDVLGPDNELVHVKWLGRAQAASHLFIQAQVSADALRGEPEAMSQLTRKIRDIDPERVLAEPPDTVVLAAAGRSWRVDSLFTLSQIALLRLDRTLRSQRMTLAFADIPYVPKRKQNRRAA